jgi:hypothetical protein
MFGEPKRNRVKSIRPASEDLATHIGTGVLVAKQNVTGSG